MINDLPGITRSVIIDMIRDMGYRLREEHFGLAEAFTAAAVAPVVETDGRKIGDGAPGLQHYTRFVADT